MSRDAKTTASEHSIPGIGDAGTAKHPIPVVDCLPLREPAEYSPIVAGRIVIMISTIARRAMPTRRFYGTYRSPYAPKYATQPHVNGITIPNLVTSAVVGSGFAISAGIFALYFFGEVPRVRHDILTHVPIIGSYWQRSIAPEDNPF